MFFILTFMSFSTSLLRLNWLTMCHLGCDSANQTEFVLVTTHTHRLNAYIKKKPYILMIIFHKIMFLKRIWENQNDIFFQMQITFIWDVSYIINHIHRWQAVKWYRRLYFVESSDDLCINNILTWDKQRKSSVCLFSQS